MIRKRWIAPVGTATNAAANTEALRIIVNIEQALQALEVRKQQFQSMIPAQASRMRTRFLQQMAEEQVAAARMHLQAIYESHLEVGPDFTPLAEHLNHPKYAFWLEGIRRHLRECEAALAEQPDAGSGDAS